MSRLKIYKKTETSRCPSQKKTKFIPVFLEMSFPFDIKKINGKTWTASNQILKKRRDKKICDS